MADAPATRDAVFRIVVNADIQRVWRELTKTDEAQGAVFNAWLHTSGLIPGGRLQMRTGSGKHVLVVGEVVEFDPPHRFVHTHRFTQYDDPVCRVAYELKEVPGGVEVTLRVFDLPLGTATATPIPWRMPRRPSRRRRPVIRSMRSTAATKRRCAVCTKR